MTDRPKNSAKPTSDSAEQDESTLIAARRDKLMRWRDELGIDPYGQRVDGIITLAEARAAFSQEAHDAHKDDDSQDARKRVLVSGRCIQHRLMGKLAFIVLRDASGDLQISVSKSAVGDQAFKVAGKLDYGDIVVAKGPIGKTQKGEICVWADQFEVHSKSLVPPPEKFHGLQDEELRYRHRYIDMYANPETIQTFQLRSQIVAKIRQFMEQWEYLEVETPIMQPMAGGAAARPFITHHNALDIDLYLRVAPELYLKRLLVGGLTRIYELNRCFRNEGVDRSHNPEFTQLEAYEAFGNSESMLELTETLINELACFVCNEDVPTMPFGELEIDYSVPFQRIRYDELFEKGLGFPMTDVAKLREKAKSLDIEKAESMDQWLLVNEVYERVCEPLIDLAKPTFVTDYPAVISPLTRPQRDRPELCERWELLIGGMEIGTAYTELNDPDVQLEKFTEQLQGADDETKTFRTLDEDFLHALRVGMPPAGGLGLGVDRIVMLLTNNRSIRDVILFPLLKPIGGDQAK